MSKASFAIIDAGDEYVVLEFKLREALRPDDLHKINPPSIPHGKILLITGRGPIWFYGYLLHHYVHLARAVAFYDPKIPGYVVVASHTPDLKPGDVIQNPPR